MKRTLLGSIAVLLSLAGNVRAERATVRAEEVTVRARDVIPAPPKRWWPEATQQAVERAGEQRDELTRALEGAQGGAQRAAMRFLVENMPERDRRGISAEFLLKDVALAVEAREEAPWANSLPDDIFLNQILPYANASERRESWREAMRARCLPLIEGCTTPAHAARRLNETLFSLVKVKYSTGRAKADQAPGESLASGLASCTGLSILLVDACRSVGVPARMVGIPDWIDGRGNHTWVEIWDAGTWHFLGAAEPDKLGLDHAWFERDAALAQKDSARHAIYAVSFRRTGLAFPIAWGPDSGGVDAENVTDRYTRSAQPAEPPAAGAVSPAPTSEAAAGIARVKINVREGRNGPRVAAEVRVTSAAAEAKPLRGVTKDGSADTNNVLSFDLPQGQTFELEAEYQGRRARRRYAVGTEPQAFVEVTLEAGPNDAPAAEGTATTEDALRRALKHYFSASEEEQNAWRFQPAFDEALAQDPALARRLAWEAYRQASARSEPSASDAKAQPTLAADFAANRVRFRNESQTGHQISPYTLRRVGNRPAGGWGLVIAMHGGGGAPKEVNDSQWRIMQSYYRDHPESGGYLYLALRAPNDTWNGFYDDYIYPLMSNLIRQVAVCEEVDLNRVYLIGYSHGGYGAFAIGPKMPDRFAAIHSSAAAPTDGLISPKTLRNTAFDFAVGEFDTAYGRRERCEAFARVVDALRGDRTDIFPVTFSLVAGRHHSDLPDHDQLREMLPHRRDPIPRELTWEQTDDIVQDFYWLSDGGAGKGREIDATCRDNRVTIPAHPPSGKGGGFVVNLDERLVDFRRPVAVVYDGREEALTLKPSLSYLCKELRNRGDIDLAFTGGIRFEADHAGKMQATVLGWP